MKQTQAQKVLAFLQTNEHITPLQMFAHFTVGNPRQVIATLRRQGYNIRTNVVTPVGSTQSHCQYSLEV